MRVWGEIVFYLLESSEDGLAVAGDVRGCKWLRIDCSSALRAALKMG